MSSLVSQWHEIHVMSTGVGRWPVERSWVRKCGDAGAPRASKPRSLLGPPLYPFAQGWAILPNRLRVSGLPSGLVASAFANDWEHR